MKNLAIILSIFFSLLLVACGAVKKQGEELAVSSEKREVIKKLYRLYKNGEISECAYNGQTVYIAAINAYDAGSVIYDKEGNEVGRCNYAYRDVDPICRERTDCEVIYRVKRNIWGEPAVDKYNLGR